MKAWSKKSLLKPLKNKIIPWDGGVFHKIICTDVSPMQNIKKYIQVHL